VILAAAEHDAADPVTAAVPRGRHDRIAILAAAEASTFHTSGSTPASWSSRMASTAMAALKRPRGTTFASISMEVFACPC
jgi:hypothetical protein